VRILGINSYFHCSSACVVEDGVVLAAVQEERLNRRKLSSEFPFKGIAWCLEQTGTKFEELDAVTFPVDLAIYLEHLNGSQISALRYRGEIGYAVADALISLQPVRTASNFVQQWSSPSGETKLHFINHHLSHAAQSYYLSPFEESAILTLDGFGEKASQLIATGRKEKIDPILWGEFPHSVGNLYATFTEFLGFRPSSEEWKLMGASSYGDPNRFFPTLSKLVKVQDGRVELDLSYFNFYLFHRPGWYTPKLVELLGPPRQRGEQLTQRDFDLAAGIQKLTEEIAFEIGRWTRKQTKMNRICLGGGVFQNSVLNGKFLENTGFECVYIPSAPDDSGGSIGSALYHLHHQLGRPRAKGGVQYNYWGPRFPNDGIENSLNLLKWPFKKLGQTEATAARIIQDGNILGWFQGGLEFGDRALGNRSILADPRNPGMKDLINARVKFREQFRPFAPSILSEKVDEFFVQGEPTPFMEKVYMIRPEKRSLIPSVTHVDGSGRLQTVSAGQNPRYHKLIAEFEKLTGIPVVLNTSFNVNNEPVVCSPEDAIRTFSSCGMDFLILGDFLIAKDPSQLDRYAVVS
jgi:carbamoyltransferase